MTGHVPLYQASEQHINIYIENNSAHKPCISWTEELSAIIMKGLQSIIM